MSSKQLLAALFLVSTACAQQPAPVMEYESVLSGVRIRHKTAVIEFEGLSQALASVFLPPNTPVTAVLTKKGSSTPLTQQVFAVSRPKGAFNRVSPRGALSQYAAKEPGDYTITYLAGRQVMTTLDFTVEVEKKDDPFDPKVYYYLKGPWDQWAYMYAPLEESNNTQPEFRMWVHKRSFADAPPADEYDVELVLNGDVIGVASTGFTNAKEGQRLQFPWQHPESKGGRAMKVSDLESISGTAYVVVKKNGEYFGVWPFPVKDGQPQLHPRQAGDYDPRSEYIVPRVSGLADRAPGMVVFMERLSDADAKAALAGESTSSSAGADIDSSNWFWIPKDLDPNRSFEFAVSEIETRTDTGFAVGEDMVVFGTGFPSGVKYMLVGDTQAREIPAGETFSSKVFCVCGRKIVLTKRDSTSRRNRVFVFDTKSERMTDIPESDISLYNPNNAQLNSHGYLVATVNKALDVSDRTILKVIDVSGDEPVIIPIKNANYTDSDVTAVAVDSKNGHFAMASRSKKLITAAKIAPLADQYLYDVSEYRGVASFRISIEGDDVTYVDEDWNVRRLELTSKSPKAITQEPIGRSGNGFWVRKGRLVTVSKTDSVGSRYPMLLTDSSAVPQAVPGTGTDIQGTSAKLGLGGSAAIAVDKTVFIAGTPGDSIGTGERLQMLTDNGWTPVIGDDGKPIWGSEVVTSMGFMALKVRNTDGKTVIGYATYGQQITPPESSSTASTKPEMKRPEGPVVPLPIEEGSSYSTDDENEYELVAAYAEVDGDVKAALEGAFGKEEARKKMLEMTINGMKSAGNEHLIDEFKRLSPLVPESEKPKATADSGGPKPINVNPQEVTQALTGDWKALRFTANGEDLPDEALENLKLIFANGTYVMQMGGNIQTGTYELNPGVYPFGLTIKIGNGEFAGQTRRGSFKFLEDDRLMLVMGTNEKDSPSRFVSSKENECILAVYRKR